MVAVNIYNRNAWYHKEIQKFIAEGEIGKLAIIRVCHMTPGVPPTEGYEPEGPPFRHCGMHYVDVARWYAGSEYKNFNSQGVCLWGHSEPWWVQAHGQFENGVAFSVEQGFVYGQLAKDKTFNSYIELIGTHGICRMRHDFKNATIEMHGVTKTVTKTDVFGDKKLDVMVVVSSSVGAEAEAVGDAGAALDPIEPGKPAGFEQAGVVELEVLAVLVGDVVAVVAGRSPRSPWPPARSPETARTPRRSMASPNAASRAGSPAR